jgi:hypothetical protein
MDKLNEAFDELKACPRCRHSSHESPCYSNELGSRFWRVECLMCGLEGPEKPAPVQNAANAWNALERRA